MICIGWPQKASQQINIYNKIVIENLEVKNLHKSPSKRWFTNGNHSLLMVEGALTSFTTCEAYRYATLRVRHAY